MHRSRTIRTLLAAALGAGLVLVAPAAAHADVTRTDFPSASQVKSSMKGTGTWRRSLGDLNAAALGARPADCRSDIPFAAATEFRNAYYMGALAGVRRSSGVVEVTVYRFPSSQSATQAMAGLPGFLSACAKSVEWWCEDCDGIATIYRTPAAKRRVGEQSVTWNQRSVGMGVSNGHAIAALEGSSVVVTVASRQTDPERMSTPRRPNWKKTLSVARKAVARARE